jgi:cytochrome c553
MECQRLRRPAGRSLPARARLLVLGTLASFAAATAPASPGAGDSPVEVGRRIYEEGVLPGGAPLTGTRPDGFVLRGAEAACGTCHRRSGYGSTEGQVYVPPAAGPLLFAPAPLHDPTHVRADGSPAAPDVAPLPRDRAEARPAYSDQTLARALRKGLDPSGLALVKPMPHYDLDDQALAALLAYLRQLSATPAPGFEERVLHLATVVTPDAPAGAREAVVGVLRAWAATRPADVRWALHVWELTGSPDTWEAQLDQRYRDEPVFAVLSGAGGTQWLPVHRFCERAALPCVLPSLEAAPDPGDDYYSLYFAPGVTLEARLLALHLQAGGAARTAGRLVQVHGDATGALAATALREGLGPNGATRIERVFTAATPGAALEGLAEDDGLVLWLRPAELTALVAGAPSGPGAGRVYLSAMLAPPQALALPASWKERVTYVSLFDPPTGLQRDLANLRLQGWLKQAGLAPTSNLRVAADAYGACYFFTLAQAEVAALRNRWVQATMNREYLLEMLESIVSKNAGTVSDTNAYVAYYKRLSLGAGQRTAVKGGALMRYAAGDPGQLLVVEDDLVP